MSKYHVVLKSTKPTILPYTNEFANTYSTVNVKRGLSGADIFFCRVLAFELLSDLNIIYLK